MKGYPVVTPSEQEGILTPVNISNITTTRQKISYPSGALWVALLYRLLPGATATGGQYVKFVVNALSDADANGKLADSTSYIALMQGDDKLLSASPSDPITRIDVIAAVAVGSEVTLLQVLAGVKS